MELATRNQWAQAIQSAQREHEARLRDVLGQSISQARAKAGELYESRVSAMKENVPELKRQGMRTAATLSTAFGVGLARGTFGDDRFNLRGVPIELILGIGAHLAAGTVLAGTPGAMVAHGAADGMLGVTVAQLEATSGYAPYGHVAPALPPGHAYAGAAPSATEADRAMAEAIEIMRAA